MQWAKNHITDNTAIIISCDNIPIWLNVTLWRQKYALDTVLSQYGHFLLKSVRIGTKQCPGNTTVFTV